MDDQNRRTDPNRRPKVYLELPAPVWDSLREAATSQDREIKREAVRRLTDSLRRDGYLTGWPPPADAATPG